MKIGCSIFLFILWNPFLYGQASAPLAEPDPVYDTLHGNVVLDQFRYLEDNEDPRTIEWIKNQNQHFNKLNRKLVRSEEIKNQIKNLSRIRYSKFGDWDIENEEKTYDFRIRSSREDRAPDLYFKKTKETDYIRLVRSREFRNSPEDQVLIKRIKLSPDDKYLAVSISHSGQDLKEIYVYDLATRKRLDDVIDNTLQARVIWDDNGFYYDAVQLTNDLSARRNQTLNYHTLGQSGGSDRVIFNNPDTTGSRNFTYSQLDETELIINYSKQVRGKWYEIMGFSDLGNGIDNFLIKDFLVVPEGSGYEIHPQFISGDTIVCKANVNTPNYKVVTLDLNNRNALTNLIPETDQLLTDINRLGKNHFACFYRQQAAYTVLIFDYAGNFVKKLEFPPGSTINGFRAKKEDLEAYYWVSSYTHPNVYYKMDLSSWVSSRMVELSLPYNQSSLEVTYVEYPSSDGTLVPMHIIKKKDLKMKGDLPTLLYAYGGYGTTLEPKFSEEYILWLMNGGVLAIPNIRGGGVEGSKWALEGRGINKINAVDDFIGAAEYLIESGYTQTEKLAIKGGSHGGFLVGAAMTKRPDLFKVVVATAGAFDMVRFKKFTVGSTLTNVEEFGDPDKADEFPFIYDISPYHNLKEGQEYPSLLLVTGAQDDRVPPLHSYKFLAKFQSLESSNFESYIRINEGAGHNVNSSSLDYLETTASIYLFIMDQFKMNLKIW